MPLTYDQFRYAFANAVDEDEAKQLYDAFAVPAPGAPLFQAATANLNRGPRSGQQQKPRPRPLSSSPATGSPVPGRSGRLFKKQKRKRGSDYDVLYPRRGDAPTIQNDELEGC